MSVAYPDLGIFNHRFKKSGKAKGDGPVFFFSKVDGYQPKPTLVYENFLGLEYLPTDLLYFFG